MDISTTKYEELITEGSGESNFEKRASGTTSRTDHRASFGRRRGKSPQQFNGIHRRRTKRIRW